MFQKARTFRNRGRKRCDLHMTYDLRDIQRSRNRFRLLQPTNISVVTGRTRTDVAPFDSDFMHLKFGDIGRPLTVTFKGHGIASAYLLYYVANLHTYPEQLGEPGRLRHLSTQCM